MRKAIDEETLRALVETAAVREIQVVRGPGGAGFHSAHASVVAGCRSDPKRAAQGLGIADGDRAVLLEGGHSTI